MKRERRTGDAETREDKTRRAYTRVKLSLTSVGIESNLLLIQIRV